jgi:RNA polymerase sigma factor (sigma-70 family)
MAATLTATARRVATELGDDELVAAVRAGDDRAFELLYDRYQRRIAAYINGMVGDHGRSEEISQDVFISALRRMRETDRPLAFKPWIYEIAKNACIDQFRRSRRAEEISYDVDEGMGAAESSRYTVSSIEPADAVAQKLQLEDLRGAFGGLSETHHEILVMRELEGLSYREIGERLGLSRPSVESTLFRARRRLSAEYDEIVTGERCRRTQRLIGTLALGESVGARDKRQLARHIAYCQPCRRHARRAGVESSGRDEVRRRVGLAAFLPFPFLRRRAGAADGAQFASGHVSTVAQWSANVGSSLDPIIASWTKAVAAAATIALAGAGAGVATHHGLSLRGALNGIAGVKTVAREDATSRPAGSNGPGLRERSTPRAALPAGGAKPPGKSDEATTLFVDPTGQLPTPPPAPVPTDPSTWPDHPNGRLPTNPKLETGGGSDITPETTVAAVVTLVDRLTGQDSDDDDGSSSAAAHGG